MTNRSNVHHATTAEMGRLRFHLSYYLPSRPVLITDGAAHWKAYQEWEPSYLKRVLDGKLVTIKTNPHGVFDYNEKSRTGKVQSFRVPFGEAVDLVTSETAAPHYVQQEALGELPELISDLERPYLLDMLKIVVAKNLWFGARGCKSPLHYDPVDNFLVQIRGTKRVFLFPPSESSRLYPAVGDKLPHCSRVNVFEEHDQPEFPSFHEARKRQTEVLLKPGNILFIPHRWWHAVESLETSISVNYWWGSPTLILREGLSHLLTAEGRAGIREYLKLRRNLSQGRAG